MIPGAAVQQRLPEDAPLALIIFLGTALQTPIKFRVFQSSSDSFDCCQISS